MTDTANEVALVAGHWKPRFTANGIDVNDFETVMSTTERWRDWAPNWRTIGDTHLALADEAAAKARWVSATGAYQRAAWSYHIGKFVWFEDPALHETLRALTAATYAKAMPRLDPPATRVEIPFEGASIPGIFRAPRGLVRPALVILAPGLDSVKEELYTTENEFLRRGLATLAIDGPGQGESAKRFPLRADWTGVIGAVIDAVERRDLGIDHKRIGLMGVSLGGYYAPRAAVREKRIRAVVALAGCYDFAETWAALNPLTKAAFTFYTQSRDEAEASAKAKELSLRGLLKDVTCPVLVVHGAKDRLIPADHAVRIAREVPDGTLLMYPEGNHVCNNIPYKYRPAMADWLREKLAT